MDYKNHSVEDFVLDESFRNWVLYNTKESRIFWNQWLEENPHKAETLAKAIQVLKQLPVQQDTMHGETRDSISIMIEKGINDWEESVQTPKKQEVVMPISAYSVVQQKMRPSFAKKRQSRPFLLKIAAFVFFSIGIVYAASQSIPNDNSQQAIVYDSIVKENPVGQKLAVFLSDGSRVMLNAGSKIKFTTPFPPDQRSVILEGEAFFEVAKDTLRPFQVTSGSLTTTALGTSFNILAYPRDESIEVSLISGKVKVDAQAQESEINFLLPGEQFTFKKDRQVLTKKQFDPDKVLAWKEGIISLENADQATVVKTLERWYGVQIEVQGHSGILWNITAKFNNQSLENVLTSLSFIVDFDFEIRENHILIKYSNSFSENI